MFDWDYSRESVTPLLSRVINLRLVTRPNQTVTQQEKFNSLSITRQGRATPRLIGPPSLPSFASLLLLFSLSSSWAVALINPVLCHM